MDVLMQLCTTSSTPFMYRLINIFTLAWILIICISFKMLENVPPYTLITSFIMASTNVHINLQREKKNRTLAMKTV